ncbi:UNC-like C-terminal-domain-containing protein [Mycena olivaceomarginata]|nr:UNC-like C-terminal-domain-containing protein [Mycena olivaceomarginata]
MSFAGTPLGQGRRRDHATFLGKPQSSRINSHTSYAYGAPTLGSRSPPKVIRQNSSESQQSLDPEKWSVKDTSVNIAAAFHQAATDMQTPNGAWASGSTRTTVPRSTSVEYESQTQSTSARRLAAPPSRIQSRPSSTARSKPLSKSASFRHVPDSEGEDDPAPEQNGRGKSPFDQVIGAAKRAIINAPAAATYYVRQRSREPDEPVAVNNSYDYSAEERDIQSQAKRAAANHKRNRMSTDNKAYKPSTSDRRKKKKKEPTGGPLTSLPVAGYDKRRKKAKKASKGNAGEVEEGGSDSDSHGTDKQSAPRDSAPPSRRSQQPEQLNPDTSFEEAEQGLHSIPEVEDEDIPAPPKARSRSRSRGPSSTGSRRSLLGAYIGTFFHAIFLLFGKVLGTMIDVMLIRPARLAARSPVGPLFKYAVILGVALFALRTVPDLGLRLPWGGNTMYTPSPAPAANVAEITKHLQRMETALSGLVLDFDRIKTKVHEEARVHAEVVGKLGALETKVDKETVRTHEAEAAVRDAAGLGIKGLKQELVGLQALVEGIHQGGGAGGGGAGTDEEARAKLKALEGHFKSLEGGVREVLEATKKGPASPAGSPWWKSGKSGMTIKSSDGQDVTGVIADLVGRAVGLYGKDNLARRDYALSSSGGMVIPSLTSPTYELRPSTMRGKIVGLVTGNGYGIARPPVTAIHHEVHDGHCWPFAGSQGQLGVVLSAPVYIEDITIDHVAGEVAPYTRGSAPREMEVWGLIEGPDNVAKLKTWRADRAQRRESGEVLEDEPVRPKLLTPRSIKALGIDFGVVALVVKNNWGNDAFTCLYRFRVHGQMMGASATPYPEELSP